MRCLIVLPLACLVAAGTAAAVYDPDAVAPSDMPALELDFEVMGECAADCLHLATGDLSAVLNGLHLEVSVHNWQDDTVFVRLATNGHLDDPVDDAGAYTSTRSEVLADLVVPAGETGHAAVVMPGDARAIMVTATAGGQQVGRMDQEINVYTIASGTPEPEPEAPPLVGDPQTDGQGGVPDTAPQPDPNANDGDPAPDPEERGAPFVHVAMTVALLALIAALRLRRP